MEYEIQCKAIRYGSKLNFLIIDPVYLMYDVIIKKNASEKDLGAVSQMT